MPNIPCPKCQTKIEFDLKDVTQRKTFICNSCKSEISMTYEDNKHSLDKAEKELKKLKDELGID